MPAVSRKQRIAMSIAEHNPKELYKRNQDMMRMTQRQLHDYASTSERDLPEEARKNRKRFKSYAKGRGQSVTSNLST